MLEIKPVRWNSVVAGKWNPAILTPKGIALEIFKKDEDATVEVLVPLDAMAPSKVRIDGFVIAVDYNRLVIDSAGDDWDSLEKAKEYCVTAINALPKTPMSAAGFNIRFVLTDPEDSFIELLEPPLDTNISDAFFSISRREIRRSLDWRNGSINIHITKGAEPHYEVLLNFDYNSSKKNELVDWLKTPIDDVKTETTKVICKILRICEEEELS